MKYLDFSQKGKKGMIKNISFIRFTGFEFIFGKILN